MHTKASVIYTLSGRQAGSGYKGREMLLKQANKVQNLKQTGLTMATAMAKGAKTQNWIKQ